MTKKSVQNIYQIKITLNDSKPPIWRRLLISSSIRLSELHTVIQIAMGWDNSHLHHFIAHGEFYGNPEYDAADESKVKLDELLQKTKSHILYEYDFGDSWQHKIELEKILPYDVKIQLPSCIKGKRACPPEDCGGIWGYEEFLEVMADPNHPEYAERLEWMGEDFDPEYFQIDEINALFAKETL
jgi:hypothetical protein